jgi:hypothetical protein
MLPYSPIIAHGSEIQRETKINEELLAHSFVCFGPERSGLCRCHGYIPHSRFERRLPGALYCLGHFDEADHYDADLR